MSEAIVIAVDGPAGAGKGELTRRLAEVLDFIRLGIKIDYKTNSGTSCSSSYKIWQL